MLNKILSLVAWIILWFVIVFWYQKYIEKNEIVDTWIDFSQLDNTKKEEIKNIKYKEKELTEIWGDKEEALLDEEKIIVE